ncbi:probable 39S ribosomal protein L45, mitochondrial [Chrysoperla carnea]|uniref:probable 39S ribosomal protein L45, mitochondrial n=1 Tax=Chrysoperla carnea TaxID=189513 RepID=UPI001D089D8E|nr:probable 39S ribosomal protein L45, mitochondrial [Chrysoperla carnea]
MSANLIRNNLKFLQIVSNNFLEPNLKNLINYQVTRHRRTKHFNPKFKWFRTRKYIKFEIPNLNEKSEDLPPDEIRKQMKKMGVLPPRPWMERPFYISCTGDIFEPYVPPEGDGKVSIITTTGAKQKLEFIEKKSKSMMAVRKIRSYDDDFEPPEFCEEAQEIYRRVHEYMMAKDLKKLEDVATERAYPEIIHNIKNKTINWKFLKSIEPPRLVHARCTDVVSKENMFAQVTVRFHTQQLLAIYDRFGRLMHGSEILAKDVLEYVVFEKHISNEYGVWRLHAKIIPDWLPKPEPSSKTYIKEPIQPVEEDQSKDVVEVKNTDVTKTVKSETLATV